VLFPTPPLQLAPDFWLLQGFASSADLLGPIAAVAEAAPFRHYAVTGGQRMAVAMTSCGTVGWTSSEKGYAYLPHDPQTGHAWPAMPASFQRLAAQAAAAAGWPDFTPDSCLINRYAAGAGMGLHQDRDEQDFSAPIVSVSIGAACNFMLGGLKRGDAVQSIKLHDGDVMVWGGPSRLRFHGVRPLPRQTTAVRHNLTFRKAL
jgi:DNA oxidative demethylase